MFVFLNVYSQDALKVYNIKSGIIEYKHSGMRSGTSTMYFDDYGQKSANYSVLTTNGKTQKSWTISLGDMQYIFDPDTKTGQKLRNPMIEMLKEMDDREKFADEIYIRMGFKNAGTEKYLGKDCQIFKGDIGKVLTWNGILMFLEMNIMDNITRQEATRVEVNVPVKASYFEVPQGITFTELPGFELEED
jgi:hypothetical protein